MNRSTTLLILSLIVFSSVSVLAQPVLVKEIPNNSTNFTSANGTLFFFSGNSLWKSDATSGGTIFVKELNEAPTPDKRLVAGNTMYFTTTTADGKKGVWKTDGTAGGTSKITSFNAVIPAVVYKNEPYYIASDEISGKELWKITSTHSVMLLKDINPGSADAFTDWSVNVTISNNLLYFAASTGAATQAIFKSDGTPNGTVVAIDKSLTRLTGIADVDGTLYFVHQPYGNDYYFTVELWKSNGTSAGSSIVKKFTDNEYDPRNLTAFKGKLLFFNHVNSYYDELWISDGTESGTRKLKDVGMDSWVYDVSVGNDYVTFGVDNQGYSPGIWRTDGTSAGTIVYTNTSAGESMDIVKCGSLLMYTQHDGPAYMGNADNDDDANQLFQSGYDPGNSKAVRKIFGSGSYASSSNLTDANGKLFFTTGYYNRWNPETTPGNLKLWYYDPSKPVASSPYFTLINADTDKDIQWLRNGDTIVKPGGMNIAIRYNPVGTPGSVVFKLADTLRRVESGAPYSLAGDNGGNYSPWLEARQGNHKLIAIPYSQASGTGTQGTPLTVNFYIKTTVVKQAPVANAGPDQTIYLPKDSTVLAGTATDADGTINSKNWKLVSAPLENSYPTLKYLEGDRVLVSGMRVEGTYVFGLEAEDNEHNIGYDEVKVFVKQAPAGPRVEKFVLLNADSDADIRTINDGDIVYLGTLATQNLNIKVVTNPSTVAKIVIEYNGTSRTESVAPYSVFGDNSGDFKAVNIQPGLYTLTATPYTSSGTAGVPLTIRYEVKTGKPNEPPVADGGANRSVFTNTGEADLVLVGKAFDPEGKITYKNWNNITTSSMYVSSVGDTAYIHFYTYGQHWVRYSVMDDKGVWAEDDVLITVASQPSAVSVKSFTLVNADTDTDIKTLANGETINLSQLPTKNLDIRANTDAGTSFVVFYYDNSYTQDFWSPFAFFGGYDANYVGGKLAPGTHTLKAVPFDETNWVEGKSMSITFTVVDGPVNKAPVVNAGADKLLTLPANSTTLAGSATDSDGSVVSYSWTKVNGPSYTASGTASATLQLSSLVEGMYTFRLTATDNKGASGYDEVIVTVQRSGQSVISFTLMNADTDQPIRDIANNEVIDMSILPTKNINVRVNTNPSVVGSVKLKYDGASRLENGAPYSLFGDSNGDYKAASFGNGSHTLSATPYSGSNASGTTGNALTIQFSVINGSASRMAAWENEGSGITLSAYPNPVDDRIVISTNDELSETMMIRISDNNGREYLAERRAMNGRELVLDIASMNMAPGIYVLKVEPSHAEGQTLKFVKR